MITSNLLSKILGGVVFCLSAPKCLFILYNSFSLRLTENLHKPKKIPQHMIYMFCLYHFSLKSIIKKNYLPPYAPITRVRAGTECAIEEEQYGFRQGRGQIGKSTHF